MIPTLMQSISARLLAGFSFILLLMAALTFLSINEISGVSTNLEQINKVNSVKQRYAINYRGSVHDRAIAIRDVTLMPTVEERNVAIQEIEKLEKIYAENEVKMTDMVNSEIGATDEEFAILDEIASIQSKTNPLVEQIITLQNNGQVEQAKSILLEQVAPLFVDWLAAINKYINYQERINNVTGELVSDSVNGYQNLSFTILLVSVAIGVAVAYFTSKSIVTPLALLQRTIKNMSNGNYDTNHALENRKDEIGAISKAVLKLREKIASDTEQNVRDQEERSNLENQRLKKMSEEQNKLHLQTEKAVKALEDGLKKLASGDLTIELKEPFIESIDGLRKDFNNSVAKINQTMRTISESAQSIDFKSSEMRDSASSLSKRTETQAASLEETSAALEEITATVGATSASAQEAREVAERAQTDTNESSEVVNNAISAMERIETASQEISQIIVVIDEIAFQTNLLALNAGVEAARAGEAGSGFAVVAQEVRELAQRSAEAAKEINNLITKSNVEVSNGVGLVNATGESLGKISVQVAEMNEKMASISTAAEEQLAGIREVNSAVSNMDQTTQQNAAMVEESTAVTFALTSEVEGLNKMLSQFSLDVEARKSINKHAA